MKISCEEIRFFFFFFYDEIRNKVAIVFWLKKDLSRLRSVYLTLKAPVLLVTLKVISANSVDPDQTAPLGAV